MALTPSEYENPQDTQDTWHTISYGTGNNVIYTKKQNVLYINLAFSNAPISSSSTVVATLPSGYRPMRNFQWITSIAGYAEGKYVYVSLNTAGELRIMSPSANAYGTVSCPLW